MIYSQWNILRETPVVPEALLQEGFSPLLSAILAVRRLDTPEEARRFLEVGASVLGDPLLLQDMPSAVRRLQKAVNARERVAVYGDYDVDGITSTCMMTDYLRGRGLDCRWYIPDRLGEGYGVNKDAIDALHDDGVTLIVTVDCGVTTVEEAAYAASKGIDMVITDHHECRDELPDAFAVVDPKRPDCYYPSHDLAGVGVAFKLLCALEGSAEPILDRYADLVAVGTVADVMPLVGENRYIVKRGLEKLNDDPRPGLRALIDAVDYSRRQITATSVGFTLAPRLNASGRLGNVESAVRLLLSGSAREARECADDLCRMNQQRQEMESAIWEEAQEMLGDAQPDGPIILARENWHQGVIGIAASRLSEKYSVPTVMISLSGDKGKGSCRSSGGFNLFTALSACAAHLEGYGGHALAAGLTIRRENIEAFRAAFAEYYRNHAAECVSTLDIDLCVDDPALLTLDCVEDLDRMEPCGTGNPRPRLCLRGARLTALSPIGNGRHLRLRAGLFGETYEAVFFHQTPDSLGVRPGDRVDLAFYPQVNEFRDQRSVQLLLSDVRPHALSAAERDGILSGTLPAEASAPTREEFERLWRALRDCGGGFSAPGEAFCDALCPGMDETKLLLALMVFEELGLVTLSRGGTLGAVCREGVRAELNRSALLARLRGEDRYA